MVENVCTFYFNGICGHTITAVTFYTIWLSEDRSDQDQRLSVSDLIERAKALLKNLKRINPEGKVMTSRQLLNSACRYVQLYFADSFQKQGGQVTTPTPKF